MRRGTVNLLLVVAGIVGCAHGEPNEAASNLDAAMSLDGEFEDVNSSDGPKPEGSAPDGPTDGGVPDVVEEAAPPCEAALVINEVQTAGVASADDEFVELHNAGACTLVLDGFTLLYRSADGVTDLLVWTAVPGQKMTAGQYFLLGGKDYGSAPDFQFPAQVALGANGGGLGLLKDEVPVDSVGWGGATNDYVEGTAAPAPPAGKSIGRLPNGSDTGDNGTDFLEMTPTPRKPNTPL